MNSSISVDLNREHLALEAAKCLSRLTLFENRKMTISFVLHSYFTMTRLLFSENIFANSQNVTKLHKELLEINLSITAYIQESRNRLEELRFDLAHQATSSQRVVDILSDTC